MSARARVALALAAACLASYAVTLRTVGFAQDDRWVVGENALLRGGLRAAPELLTTGYWQQAQGRGAPVREWRPVLMASFLFHFLTTGADPRPMHAANLLIHFLVALLLWEVLRERLKPGGALAAALLFAVLPIHAEAVCALTGRSELLSAALVLGAWLCALRRRAASACALYAAAALTKEHALLFPLLLALDDRTRRVALDAPRRRLYLGLAGVAAVVLAARAAVVPGPLGAGRDYFAGVGLPSAALTFARFVVRRYALPTATGVGLCADFGRPLIPDQPASSLSSWACLLALAAFVAASVVALGRRRAVWAFWIVGPGLFLLPTAHLLPIDAIGGERFLYFPTIGLAALFGLAYDRAARVRAAPWVAGALIVFYAARAAARSADWTSPRGYDEAAVACNPVSVGARAALGADRLESGDASGEADLAEALSRDPSSALAAYDLARLAWGRNDARRCEGLVRRALASDPGLADGWSLLALALESRGARAEAVDAASKAVALRSWDPAARYGLARELQIAGMNDRAAVQYAKFLELAPDDPDAPRVRALLSGSAR